MSIGWRPLWVDEQEVSPFDNGETERRAAASRAILAREAAQARADAEAGRLGPCPALARSFDRQVRLPWQPLFAEGERAMTEFTFALKVAQREGWISEMLADAVCDNLVAGKGWAYRLHPESRAEIEAIRERLVHDGLTAREAEVEAREAEAREAEARDRQAATAREAEFRSADSRFAALLRARS